MKSIICFLFFLVLIFSAAAQTEFEGSYAYKTTIDPLIKELSIQSVQNLLMADDSTVGWYKNGYDKKVNRQATSIHTPR